MTRAFLTLHKWIGISVGVFLFVWLVSGIVMILPMQRLAPAQGPGNVDLTTLTLAPAEALALVRSREGDTARVFNYSLVVIGGEAYYRIQMKGGANHLISATTGERLVIGPERAETLARAGLSSSAPVTSVTEVKAHSLGYANGPLPAWRVEFGDGRKTVAWVGARDGSVSHDTRLRRVRSFVAQMHTFDQLRTLTGSKLLARGSLGTLSAITILLVLTGYYLALPKRWRRRAEPPRSGAA